MIGRPAGNPALVARGDRVWGNCDLPERRAGQPVAPAFPIIFRQIEKYLKSNDFFVDFEHSGPYNDRRNNRHGYCNGPAPGASGELQPEY
ncbi:MAG: hypothetical protein GDA39_01025 [Hyphomonadaceae bacterium]|nr:hypothetical protein [Hyphomonadaceae bacterium]